MATKSPDGEFSLTYKVDGEASAAAANYKNQLTSAGFSIESDAASAALGGFQATGQGYNVLVLSLGGAGVSGLTVAVEKQ